MIFIAVVGGLILLAIVLGAVSHYRARRGLRTNDWNEEALQNRLDVDAVRSNPLLAGRGQRWMTYRRRDRKPDTDK